MADKRPPFGSLGELAEHTARNLDRAGSNWAFQLFNEKTFRQQAGFDRLSQSEQDRIFNELVVATVVLVMLLLEAPDLRVPDEFKEYLADLKGKMPEAHVDGLRELAIKDEHLRDWKKLIGMRYDEYAKDRHDVRAAAMQLASADKELDTRDLAKIQLLVPVQSVAIGCHHHVCRGETEGRDELFRTTLRSLSEFYVTIRLGIETGKTGPLKRARMALKRLLCRWRGR